jgi:hypothetical protein
MTTPPPFPAPKKKSGCLKVAVIASALLVAFLAYAIHQGGKLQDRERAEKAQAEAAERARLEKQAEEAASHFPEAKARVLDILKHVTDEGDESTVAGISDKYRKVADPEYAAALKSANDRIAATREQKQVAQLFEQRRIAEATAKQQAEDEAKRTASEKAKAEAEFAALPQVSAANLHKEYDENEVTADAKWKGKTVVVSGKIHSIEKDFTGDAYVTLSWEKYGFETVRCDFGKNMEPLKTLKKGDSVKIKGRVNGFLMHNVMIRDCALPERTTVSFPV